jgi:alpha-L-rhamnosidase
MDLGPSGSHLTLTYGEALDENGDVTTDNIDSNTNAAELSLPEAARMPDDIGPLQVDEITSAGSRHDVFEPRMSTKGVRYVRVEGHPRPLSRNDCGVSSSIPTYVGPDGSNAAMNAWIGCMKLQFEH